MNTKTLDQIKNEYYGEVGAPERDRLERELEALRIGFKIRSARHKQSLQVALTRNVHSYQKLKTMEKILLSKHYLIL